MLDDEQWDREWQALVDRAGEAGRILRICMFLPWRTF